MAEAYVTTSWDDGPEEDFRIAELLSKYAVPGCFYIPRENPERGVMSERQIRELSRAHEIGGHTLHHLPLTTLSDEEARAEVHDGKRWLEDVIGRETSSFCYPCGQFTAAHVREVQQAGYRGARTADWMCLDPGRDPFRAAPSLHLYPHSALVNVAHCVRRGHPRELLRYVGVFRAAASLRRLADAMLDYIEEHGGVFHVWGHGWEIAEQGLWSELEAILVSISHRPALRRLSNAALTTEWARVEAASARR